MYYIPIALFNFSLTSRDLLYLPGGFQRFRHDLKLVCPFGNSKVKVEWTILNLPTRKSR